MAALSRVLLHITTLAEWSAAAVAGTYGAERLAVHGFVHLSTPEQVALPATSLFLGRSDLWLLVVDETRLPVPITWEPGDPPAGDESLFPHLYAPLPASAVVAAVPYAPRSDGTFDPPLDLPAPGDQLRRAYAFEWYLARARATRVGPAGAESATLRHGYAVSHLHNRLVLRREETPTNVAGICARELAEADHWQIHVEGPLPAHSVAAWESAGWSHSENLLMAATATSSRRADPDVQVIELDVGPAADVQSATLDQDIPRLRDPELRQLVVGEVITVEIARHLHLVVQGEDGHPAAWADVIVAGATAQLENVITRPDQRGRGLATAVVLEAVDRARRMDCDLVFLRADAEDWPVHLYERLGFRAIGTAHVLDRDVTTSP